MSVFFDVCVRCRRTFTNEAEYQEHMRQHATSQFQTKKPIDEVEEQIKLEAQTVPGMSEMPDEDSRLAAVKKVNTKRKKLIAAGIEAATMTGKEVEERYEAEKKKGTVK